MQNNYSKTPKVWDAILKVVTSQTPLTQINASFFFELIKEICDIQPGELWSDDKSIYNLMHHVCDANNIRCFALVNDYIFVQQNIAPENPYIWLQDDQKALLRDALTVLLHDQCSERECVLKEVKHPFVINAVAELYNTSSSWIKQNLSLLAKSFSSK